MNVSNVAIIKSQSPFAAIQESIKTFFNAKASAEYLASIKFEDGVATSSTSEICKYSGDTRVSTTYFIPTIINSSLVRVEYCYGSEVIKAPKNDN